MSRPSQKLIAEKLGISVAAVSLALRNKGTVSQKLTAEVKAMAEAVGYRPNPMLASLASHRFRDSGQRIAVPIAMIDLASKGMGPGQYATELAQRAEALGYILTTVNAEEFAQYHNPAKTLHNRGVQGLVLIGPVKDATFREDFDWSLFSVVQCGRFLQPLPFDTVRPNIFQSMKLAYLQAKSRGYHRIGFALGRHFPLLEDDESRLSAALGLQRLHEPDGPQIPPYFGDIADRDALVAWAKEHRPDCAIGFHVGQCRALRQAGLRIPEEIGYACLHLHRPFYVDEAQSLRVSGNDQNLDEIARQTINLLDQKIIHHERGLPEFPKHLLINSSWVEGASLPDRRSAR